MCLRCEVGHCDCSGGPDVVHGPSFKETLTDGTKKKNEHIKTNMWSAND